MKATTIDLPIELSIFHYQMSKSSKTDRLDIDITNKFKIHFIIRIQINLIPDTHKIQLSLKFYKF